MPKIEVTNRRKVDAKSKWFETHVDESRVSVKTDFGTVVIRRVQRGVEIELIAVHEKGTFYEVLGPDYARKEVPENEYHTGPLAFGDYYTLMLRPVGEIQMGEMLKRPELKKLADKYYKPKKPKN